MKIHGIRNLKTGEVIYSRAHHDFHSDSTGDISVDGGFEYMRVCWKPEAEYEHVEFELDVTKNELYQDWNTRGEKYGWLTVEQIKEQNIEIVEVPYR